jgi:hypothetical protein
MTDGSQAGVECWRGPSLLTGDQIAVVLTGIYTPSRNAKTGPMVQAYIVPTTVHAGRAVGTPAERAVCGDCPLRGSKKTRLCYVTWGVWVVGRHMEAGNFRPVELSAAADMLEGRLLRLGAYGDPAAVPTDVWTTLLAKASNWTGYTHQWQTCDPALKRLIMASCETEDGAREANAAGWRTFRIRWPGAAVRAREIVCPEESRGITCDRCRLCRGTATGAKNIVITAHGSAAGKFAERYRQIRLPLFEETV